VAYPRLVDPREVPRWKRALARLGFPVYMYTDGRGFKAPMKIYLAYCPKHRVYFLDYQHGYTGYLLCPLCLEEERREVRRGAEAEARQG